MSPKDMFLCGTTIVTDSISKVYQSSTSKMSPKTVQLSKMPSMVRLSG